MRHFSEENNILIVDIGSTTTKGLLLEKGKDGYFFRAISDAPTTVERPYEDVNIGLGQVIKDLEKKSAMKLAAGDGNITVPFLATSSAGGGLQALVFGLTKSETGRAVEATAYGAGAIISGSFTVDDGIPEMEKMRTIRELHPDMILLAGGIDGGGLWGVLRQAEILTLSEPNSKFMPEEKIPLVFCGNKDAAEFVKEILGENFLVHVTENIRPNLESFNFSPVRELVHRLFMENVMENAPGYKAVKKSVSKDILPTPAGVELILKKYYEKYNENTLLVDIGGATTDIFSCISSKINRTVSANIGMSYSLSNVMKEAGITKIIANVCGLISENDARDYISNKMLNPEYIPKTKGERILELSCAAEGIRIAWEQHIAMNMEISKMGFLDRRRKQLLEHKLNPFEEVFNLTTEKDIVFQLSDIKKIIGAGGVISSSASEEDIIFTLAGGFEPGGITELYVDRHFKSPHLGMLSLIDPDKASETYERETLVKVCTVVSLGFEEKDRSAEVKISELDHNMSVSMKKGEVFYSKKGGNFRFEASGGSAFGNSGKVFEINTDTGILIDCRGKNERNDLSELFKVLYGEPKELSIGRSVLRSRPEIFEGEFEISRSLPYKGELLVSKGEKVHIETIIGQNLFNPPKIYLIDLRKQVGIEEKLSADDIRSGLLVKKGDKIEIGSPVFIYKKKSSPVPFTYNSNVCGEVVKIDKYGMVVVKEIQDYSGDPVEINIAEELNIKPKDLDRYLKYREGSFVLKGQIIAQKTTGSSVRDILNSIIDGRSEKKEHEGEGGGVHFSVKSPSTGYIVSADYKTGIVSVQYKSKPFRLGSFVNGSVTALHKDLTADIKVNGSYAYCIIGFGGENFGLLSFADEKVGITERHSGTIAVFTGPVNRQILETARELKLKGIIAPSIPNRDWVDFYGKEIGVAVTGKEEIGFTLMLTSGFGSVPMDEKYIEYFRKNEGRTASVNGRTQIRAGVIRPRVIIS